MGGKKNKRKFTKYDEKKLKEENNKYETEPSKQTSSLVDYQSESSNYEISDVSTPERSNESHDIVEASSPETAIETNNNEPQCFSTNKDIESVEYDKQHDINENDWAQSLNLEDNRAEEIYMKPKPYRAGNNSKNNALTKNIHDQENENQPDAVDTGSRNENRDNWRRDGKHQQRYENKKHQPYIDRNSKQNNYHRRKFENDHKNNVTFSTNNPTPRGDSNRRNNFESHTNQTQEMSNTNTGEYGAPKPTRNDNNQTSYNQSSFNKRNVYSNSNRRSSRDDTFDRNRSDNYTRPYRGNHNSSSRSDNSQVGETSDKERFATDSRQGRHDYQSKNDNRGSRTQNSGSFRVKNYSKNSFDDRQHEQSNDYSNRRSHNRNTGSYSHTKPYGDKQNEKWHENDNNYNRSSFDNHHQQYEKSDRRPYNKNTGSQSQAKPFQDKQNTKSDSKASGDEEQWLNWDGPSKCSESGAHKANSQIQQASDTKHHNDHFSDLGQSYGAKTRGSNRGMNNRNKLQHDGVQSENQEMLDKNHDREELKADAATDGQFQCYSSLDANASEFCPSVSNFLAKDANTHIQNTPWPDIVRAKEIEFQKREQGQSGQWDSTPDSVISVPSTSMEEWDNSPGIDKCIEEIEMYKTNNRFQQSEQDTNWRNNTSLGNETDSRSYGSGRGRNSSPFRGHRVSDNGDVERSEYIHEFIKNPNFDNVTEKEADLFAMPKVYSLAHCVAEDLRMGSGIAVQFKREFKEVGYLLQQKQRAGGLATIHDEKNNRFIYYLVTKKQSTGKPTYDTVWMSLTKMRDHIKENDIRKLAIPRLACGLDRLEWSEIKMFIAFLFRNLPIEIVVCNFQQDTEDGAPPRARTSKLVMDLKHISQIDTDTVIIYLTTPNNEIDTNTRELDKKYNNKITQSLRMNNNKRIGDAIRAEYSQGKMYYLFYGCVVKPRLDEDIDYLAFEKCMKHIYNNYKKDGCEYVAFQSLDVSKEVDDAINEKMLTLMRNLLRNFEIYMCDGQIPEKD